MYKSILSMKIREDLSGIVYELAGRREETASDLLDKIIRPAVLGACREEAEETSEESPLKAVTYYDRPKIDSAAAVFNACAEISSYTQEVLMVLALDAQNRLIGKKIVFVGTANMGLVHPREIFKYAIECNAVNIILAHNHPSGELRPSKEDIAATKRMKSAGEVMGITLLDHVIIGNGYHGIIQDI